jgi:hypothetical protein
MPVLDARMVVAKSLARIVQRAMTVGVDPAPSSHRRRELA